MSSKKGFTLIELLAVILILGIISLVAIPVISKTINTAKKSSFKTSVTNSFKALDYALYKKNTNTIPEEGIDISELNLKSDFTGGKFMLIDGKETAYYIRNKSFCAYGPLNNLKITNGCESMDLTDPIVEDTKFIVTINGNNIKVVLNEGLANDPDSGIDKYVINLYEDDKLVKTQEKKNIGETTFNDLKSLTIYTVELVVYNGAGGTNISHKNIKSGVTDIPTINVSDSDIWTTSKTVTIDYDTDLFNCEYSVDGASTWNIYSSSFNITSNVTINARLIDKELSTNKGNASNKIVTKIDNIKPVVTLSKNDKIINISLSDNDSGLKSYCVTTNKGFENCDWILVNNVKSSTETYTAPNSATYYVYAKDLANNISDEKLQIMNICNYSVGKTWTYSYTGSSQSFTTPCSGTYKLEVWGAQGGDYLGSGYSYNYAGGKGGYSYGTASFTYNIPLYIYVGGKGSYSTSYSSYGAGGYNGGGSTGTCGGSNSYAYGSGGGGGGATDIRINSMSLYARVIVAGGGGGSFSGNNSSYSNNYVTNPSGHNYLGGYGGGTSGGGGGSWCAVGGNGGGSTGTTRVTNSCSNGSAAPNGSFGQGSSSTYSSYLTGTGGGGGWYGGQAGGSGCGSATGGGGSGYVYTSSTYSQYPSGCLLNSSYYLTSANTIAGNQTFTSTSGGTETGHSGNGYAKITLVSINN